MAALGSVIGVGCGRGVDLTEARAARGVRRGLGSRAPRPMSPRGIGAGGGLGAVGGAATRRLRSLRPVAALLGKDGDTEDGEFVDPWVEGGEGGMEESGMFGVVWRVAFVSLAVAATLFVLTLATPVIHVMESTFPIK